MDRQRAWTGRGQGTCSRSTPSTNDVVVRSKGDRRCEVILEPSSCRSHGGVDASWKKHVLCFFRRGLACTRRAVSSFKREKRDRRIALSQRNWEPLFSVRIQLPAELESVPARPEDYASVTLPRDRGSGPATSPSRDGKDLPSAKHIA